MRSNNEESLEFYYIEVDGKQRDLCIRTMTDGSREFSVGPAPRVGMLKPRIGMCRGKWWCSGYGVIRSGGSPSLAYNHWDISCPKDLREFIDAGVEKGST